MPRYDYKQCYNCQAEAHERIVPMSERNEQRCEKCGARLQIGLSIPALHGFDKLGRSIK